MSNIREYLDKIKQYIRNGGPGKINCVECQKHCTQLAAPFTPILTDEIPNPHQVKDETGALIDPTAPAAKTETYVDTFDTLRTMVTANSKNDELEQSAVAQKQREIKKIEAARKKEIAEERAIKTYTELIKSDSMKEKINGIFLGPIGTQNQLIDDLSRTEKLSEEQTADLKLAAYLFQQRGDRRANDVPVPKIRTEKLSKIQQSAIPVSNVELKTGLSPEERPAPSLHQNVGLSYDVAVAPLPADSSTVEKSIHAAPFISPDPSLADKSQLNSVAAHGPSSVQRPKRISKVSETLETTPNLLSRSGQPNSSSRLQARLIKQNIPEKLDKSSLDLTGSNLGGSIQRKNTTFKKWKNSRRLNGKRSNTRFRRRSSRFSASSRRRTGRRTSSRMRSRRSTRF